MSQSRSKPESEHHSHSQPESGGALYTASWRVTSELEAAMGVGQDKTVDVLVQAREAYERGDWVLAFDRLHGADDLGPEDTMTLATSAYLLGNVDDAVRALQAGYQDRIRNGDSLGAVRFAFWLGLVLNLRGEMAVGGGWVARAQRLLESETEDVVERGYLLVHEFYQHLGRGDLARAGETAARVVETGRRFTDHDLIALGLVSAGQDDDLLRSGAGRTCSAR